MVVLIISVIILVSILLVLVILAQNPKGGLSSQFGGSGTSNLIGVKKTGDLLENITWSFVAVLMILTLSMNFITDTQVQGYTSPNIERAQEQSIIPSIDIDGEVPAEPAESSDAGSESSGSLDELTDQE
jgi:preprotein translocase subunit SecG